MVRLAGMKAPRFEKDVFIRTTALAKLALESALAKLRARGVLRLKDQKTLSQEALASALWLALDSLPLERIEQMLEPEFRRLDEILAARSDGTDPAPANSRHPSVGKPIDPKPRRIKSTG